MIRTKAHRRLGFSVLELMNFLAVVAVLSTLGMYGLAKYVRHTKTAEAISSIESIAKGAALYYNSSDSSLPTGTRLEVMRASRHFPAASRGSVPVDPSDVQGKRYKSAMADWLGSPWREIRFSIPQAQFYAYSFEAEGAGSAARAVVTARGDLDANGVWSVYRLAVAPDDTTNAVVSGTIERTNPEE
jgi:Tfp pilus assembly major pilin PilA